MVSSATRGWFHVGCSKFGNPPIGSDEPIAGLKVQAKWFCDDSAGG
jgi:hypothetical protein